MRERKRKRMGMGGVKRDRFCVREKEKEREGKVNREKRVNE